MSSGNAGEKLGLRIVVSINPLEVSRPHLETASTPLNLRIGDDFTWRFSASERGQTEEFPVLRP